MTPLTHLDTFMASRDREQLTASLLRQRRARRATHDYAVQRGRRPRGICPHCRQERSVNKSSGTLFPHACSVDICGRRRWIYPIHPADLE